MKKIYFFLILIPAVLTAVELPEMINIEGGEFNMGNTSFEQYSRSAGEPTGIPPIAYITHTVALSSFSISRYEITNSQFAAFVAETGYITEPEKFNKKDTWRVLKDYHRRPVVNITRKDCLEYCRWLSEKTGRFFRLPTEAEWEYAALGGKDRLYPWGDKFKKWDARALEQDTKLTYRDHVFPVDKITGDTSPFNVSGCYGNVQEWVMDQFHPAFYRHSPVQNPLSLFGPERHQYSVRGAWTYMHSRSRLGVKCRYSSPNSIRYHDEFLGFRVVSTGSPAVFNIDSEPVIYKPATGRTILYYLPLWSHPSEYSVLIEKIRGNGPLIFTYRTAEEKSWGKKTGYWYRVSSRQGSMGWVYEDFLTTDER